MKILLEMGDRRPDVGALLQDLAKESERIGTRAGAQQQAEVLATGRCHADFEQFSDRLQRDRILRIGEEIGGYPGLGKNPFRIGPQFADRPGDDGAKLSKRHGAVSVMQYLEDGYLPEALLNYLARLGCVKSPSNAISAQVKSEPSRGVL